VKDSVGQHVKRGDSMLHGFFLERLVWSTPDNPVYRRDTTDAAMDARHLLRDAGLVDDDLESRRPAPRRRVFKHARRRTTAISTSSLRSGTMQSWS